MDIILLFLAKPLDKHATTLVHITYPILVPPNYLRFSSVRNYLHIMRDVEMRQFRVGFSIKICKGYHFFLLKSVKDTILPAEIRQGYHIW